MTRSDADGFDAANSGTGTSMVHLTTAGSTFEARVLAARLGAEGFLTELRGTSEGPYPLPATVEILVMADQLEDARLLLLADQVEAAFDDNAS
ncbi:MAG: hypothetical protein ACYCTL_09465 [Acidimicrobiales bacterium]|jgi:hypothetical protein